MSKNLLLEYKHLDKTISEGVHDNKPFTVTGVLQSRLQKPKWSCLSKRHIDERAKNIRIHL